MPGAFDAYEATFAVVQLMRLTRERSFLPFGDAVPAQGVCGARELCGLRYATDAVHLMFRGRGGAQHRVIMSTELSRTAYASGGRSVTKS